MFTPNQLVKTFIDVSREYGDYNVTGATGGQIPLTTLMNSEIIMKTLRDLPDHPEINIVSHTATDFNGMIGMSNQRAQELSQHLNDMIKSFGHSLVRITDVLNEIASFTESFEEYSWALINHIEWRVVNGHRLTFHRNPIL